MSIWRGPRERGAEEFERVEGRSDVLRGARDRLRVLSFLNVLNFLVCAISPQEIQFSAKPGSIDLGGRSELHRN